MNRKFSNMKPRPRPINGYDNDYWPYWPPYWRPHCPHPWFWCNPYDYEYDYYDNYYDDYDYDYEYDYDYDYDHDYDYDYDHDYDRNGHNQNVNRNGSKRTKTPIRPKHPDLKNRRKTPIPKILRRNR
jgi:hypothetical protein